mgnify:CR=1 FL=1|tara:strand:+ start:2251 stop:4662 length:2412 start_codon:yes stop_codon:yes gene_type:complete
MTHTITIFKNIHDTSAPFHRPVEAILSRIKNGKSKDLVKSIRDAKSKEEQTQLKKQLPAICFSGTFFKRNDQAINQHSGLICLDFDGYPSTKDMMADKKKLANDKFVYSVFISPSGLGLKVLVKIPEDAQNHKNYFNSLQTHFNSERFDISTKNISRVCYESYDPHIFINTNSNIWTIIEEKEFQEITSVNALNTIPITDDQKIIEILVKWWEKKYPMVEGQRNQNCYILASAFNDFGVNKSLSEYVLHNYSTEGFGFQEIKSVIDSAYANTHNFKSRFYEDEDKMNKVRTKLAKGNNKAEVENYLEGQNLTPKHIESVLTKLENEDGNVTFWSMNDKGKIQMIPFMFKKFLEDNGFYKYNPEGSKNYVFVKVTNNLIDHTSENEIKDFVLEYLLEKENIEVYNFFAATTRFFKEDFLTLLSSIDIFFIEDTKDTAYLYFRNCAVKIKTKDVEIIDYIDLGGYVWKDHIIDRNFDMCDSDDCDYKIFISNICKGDLSRIKSMESTIGYMLHGFKNLSYCPAIILNDEVISDNPEGGTGKGIFMNALAHMKKLVVIDGKSFAFEKSFPYQLVSSDTQILCFDDVRKNFDFERLFSVVTEGLTLEKKNKDAIKIPFEKSPKIAITTNYAIKGKGNSFERRKWELELNQYYHKNFSPLDEFGKLMFGDWDEGEWCTFDNYMIKNLQSYLESGLIKSNFVNLRIRQLSAETCHEFIEWCGLLDGIETNPNLVVEERMYMNDLYYNFIEENPDFGPKAKMTISRTRFYKWLISYAQYKEGVSPEEGRDMKGKWIRIRRKHELEQQLDF